MGEPYDEACSRAAGSGPAAGSFHGMMEQPMSRIALLVLLSALLVAAPFTAHADGDTRAATPAEQDYGLKVQTLLDQVVPPIPDGWTPGDRTEVKPVERLSTGVGKDPMRVEFFLDARDEKKIDEANQKAGKVYEEMAKYNGDDQKKMVDDMQKKLDGLTKQMEAAINANDMATFQRLTKEVEAAQAPLKTMGDAMNKELSEKMAVVKARDAHLRAVLQVNAYDVDLTGYTAEGPVAGHPAYWHENPPDHDGDFEGEWLAFAGAWKSVDQDGTPTMTPAWNLAHPHTTAQNLLVKVRGDKARGRRFLETMKWDVIGDLFPKN